MIFSTALLVSILSLWEETVVGAPPQPTGNATVQYFVQEDFMHNSTGHYHIDVVIAYMHPQPQPDFWAVVGGFVSDQNIAKPTVGGWTIS